MSEAGRTLLIKEGRKRYKVRFPASVYFVYQPHKNITVFAKRGFQKGEKILVVGGVRRGKGKNTSPESIQIARDRFIDGPLIPSDFLSHSCNPHAYIDFKKLVFIALRPIRKNEEITYHYCTTEWDLERWALAFRCACGSRNCLGRVRGFRYLSKVQRQKLAPHLSPFLLEKLVLK